jgi:hypothetical protein
LANNYVQYHNNTDELRAYAAGGNMLYPKSQNNFFTDRVSELNNSEQVTQQLRGVPYNQSSVVLNSLLNPTTRLHTVTFVNFKTSNNGDTGSDYFGITAKEDYISKMALIHNNFLLMPTVADKKTYHAISGISLFHGKVTVQNIPEYGRFMTFDEDAVNQFISYAYSDLAAVEQCINQLEGYTDDEGNCHAPLTEDQKIKNYHTKAKYKVNGKTKTVDPNGTRFRFLTGIYKFTQRDGKMVEEYIDLSDPKVSSKELVRLAKQEFFNQSPEVQKAIINRLIQKRVEDELEYATQLGVINQNGQLYSSYLIDAAE